ncbi:uncharacterized protein LOC131677094 [Topomyia yanbarensis]|uniref:uncharacterized protein LOC131677094 n=1 Tax=Topomyia yanbarensis TaxID=2498891 RepID=UPI00273C35EA|nr:uncharacterized protein LOC131677094 [Topomyia yanbarensis]XP_058812664.1 uncharacterized protein LOC131677094 [Topomyia yanbarensis]
MKFGFSAVGAISIRSSDMRFLLIVTFVALGVLRIQADPDPEPSPARVLGKYLVAYRPSDGEYHLSKQPMDLTNIPNSEYLDADAAASHSSGYAISGSGSPGYMTSYTTSTKHGGSVSYADDDSDEKPTFVSSSSSYYKRKPIIPILQQYSVIHSTNTNNGPSNSGHGSDDEDEDYYENSYKSQKVIHTKAKTVPISQHIEVESPYPVPYIKKIHVPVPKGVKIQIPHPVLVPVPQPYPVHVPVSQPVAIPVIREITIPIEKIVPYPVEKKVPVPIEKPVPYPVEKHIPVHIPQPYPVKVPVVKTIVHKLKPPRTIGVGSVTF